MTRWIACLFPLLVVVAGRAAADPPWAIPTEYHLPQADARATQLISQLGDADFQARQRAASALQALGPDAFVALWETRNSPDPEIKARIAQLLPTIPPPVHLSLQYQKYIAFYIQDKQRMLNIGFFDNLDRKRHQGLELLDFIIALETDKTIVAKLRSIRDTFSVARAQREILRGHLTEARTILRRGLPWGSQEYAVFCASVDGGKFNPAREVEALRDLPLSPADRRTVAYSLYMAAGDVDSASHNPPYDRPIDPIFALCRGDFPLYAEQLVSQIDRHENFDEKTPLALRLVGKTEESDKWLAQLAVRNKDLRYGVIAELVRNGRIEDAIALADETGLEPIRIDLDISKVAIILASELRVGELRALKPRLTREPAHVLYGRGFRDEARTLLQSAKPPMDWSIWEFMKYVKEARDEQLPEFAAGCEEEAWKYIIKSGQRFSPFPFFPDFDDPFSQWDLWDSIAAIIHPEFGLRARYNWAMDILHKKAHPSFTPDQMAMLTAHLDQLQENTSIGAKASNLLKDGFNDLAVQLLNADRARRQDDSDLAILGDDALRHQEPQRALQFYRQAAVFDPVNPRLAFTAALAMTRIPASKSEGEELLHLASLCAFANSTDVNGIVSALNDFESERAATEWREKYAPAVALTTWLLDRIPAKRDAALQRGDISEALAWQKRGLFSKTEHTGTEIGDILATVALYHRFRALDALQRRDMPTLADALDHNLASGPPDVELLEKSLPALRDVEPTAARRILTRAVDRLIPVVKDYPDIAPYKEQLARLKALQAP
jgi:hypothetical protein